MTHSENKQRNHHDAAREPMSPATWSAEELRSNLAQHLELLVADGDSTVPIPRLVMQVGNDSFFLDTLSRWDGRDGQWRINAWRNILHLAEKFAHEVIPACVRCGECCRKGSPTLQEDDLELLRQGRLPWDQLITLRRGEPVASADKARPFFLLDERIKIREKAGTQECVFFDPEDLSCAIYEDRPVQCRAQACWDNSASEELAKQPYLTRRELFADVELLLNLMEEHDRRCAFSQLDQALKKVAAGEDGATEGLFKLIDYEEHFRDFVADQLDIADQLKDLVFGRSFVDLLPLFGLRLATKDDGTRFLVVEKK